MTHPFPEESVRKEYEQMELFKADNPKRRVLQTAETIIRTFKSEGVYGFIDNLRTGLYAPWPHERYDQNIGRYNCTTIIPTIYLWTEALGYKPQIVQFRDWRQLKSKKDEDKPRANSHFALIVDVGKKHPYLIDPFWEICNPIVERTPNTMTLGKNKRYGKAKREYGTLWEYSPEEFAEMVNDLHSPAQSLEMLACGQKVDGNLFLTKEVGCPLMIYYYAQTNRVSTRLEIPQVAITDKVIFCNLEYNKNGIVKNTSLELCLVKDTYWDGVIGKVAIAQGSFEELEKVKKIADRLRLQKNKRRLGSLFREQPEKTDELCALAVKLYERLAPEEKAGLEKRLLTRTLYELTEPEKDYLTTEEERFSEIKRLRAEEKENNEKRRYLEDKLWKEGWKLEKLDRDESRRLKSRRRRLDKRSDKAFSELKDLLLLHWHDKAKYHRRIDQVEFGKKWKDSSQEELAEEVRREGYNPMVGYAAMVTDFLPFIFEAREDLELKRFQDSIGEKIRLKMENQ